MSDNEALFRQLTIKAQHGDSIAYNELLLKLASFLKNYLRRRIFEQNEVEEVIQETLLAVHKSIHTYDKARPFMSWLMSIVEYKITDFIRAIQKHKSTDIESISNLFTNTENDSDLRLDLEKAIDNLNGREKTILLQLKIEGNSINDVARELNISEANVKIIAHRAYINLKKQFGENS